ncbi:hypothetical protein B0J13DRAFT_442034 [Dactylonectria estremocensis]|uniref:Uncharacterized protein n=1 Tax=Dactylonectria estremocensis TaxID=1079267 RepID=A0A9P9EYP4_9HYPO|nr:hypothetical protein B0J13DRAFT_442034 [Dactylonectria estremocensis]
MFHVRRVVANPCFIGVATNPASCLLQSIGSWVDKWPTILSYDLADEVVSTGTDVNSIASGQRVLECALHLDLKDRSLWQYSIVRVDVVTPITDDMPFVQAAVIPPPLTTDAAGLNQKGYLDLPLPKTPPRSRVRLAVASGFGVVTTASTRNFGVCSDLGVQHVRSLGSVSSG